MIIAKDIKIVIVTKKTISLDENDKMKRLLDEHMKGFSAYLERLDFVDDHNYTIKNIVD